MKIIFLPLPLPLKRTYYYLDGYKKYANKLKRIRKIDNLFLIYK